MDLGLRAMTQAESSSTVPWFCCSGRQAAENTSAFGLAGTGWSQFVLKIRSLSAAHLLFITYSSAPMSHTPVAIVCFLLAPTSLFTLSGKKGRWKHLLSLFITCQKNLFKKKKRQWLTQAQSQQKVLSLATCTSPELGNMGGPRLSRRMHWEGAPLAIVMAVLSTSTQQLLSFPSLLQPHAHRADFLCCGTRSLCLSELTTVCNAVTSGSTTHCPARNLARPTILLSVPLLSFLSLDCPKSEI